MQFHARLICGSDPHVLFVTFLGLRRPCGELTLASFMTRSEKESMFVLDTPPPSSLASDIGTWPKPAQGTSGHGGKMDSFFLLYSKSTCVVDREAASQDTWMVLMPACVTTVGCMGQDRVHLQMRHLHPRLLQLQCQTRKVASRYPCNIKDRLE